MLEMVTEALGQNPRTDTLGLSGEEERERGLSLQLSAGEGKRLKT